MKGATGFAIRCAGWLAAGFTRAALAAQPADCPPNDALREVLPHVWVWPGEAADAHPGNQGRVSTSVVLLRPGTTPQASAPTVTVVDPGPSLKAGLALAQAIRCRWGVGVAQVINTHAHADNVLANGALTPTGSTTPVLATATTAHTMAERCPDCLDSLTQTVGADAMRGTQIVLPTATLHPGRPLPLTDRLWQVDEARHAHTRSDLLLWQPELKLLIAGGLVYRQRLPELAQGQLLDWVAALERVAQWGPQHVIGTQAGGAQDIALTRHYLCDLATAVWQAMELGLSPGEAQTIALPRYATWAGYAQRQPFNAQRAWRELEPRWMAGEAPPCSLPHVGR